MRLAKRRANEQTDEFKDQYRWRAGVEATMSQYDRRTGVKHLRVRGFKAVRFCATLKAIGINLFRATAVQSRGGKTGDKTHQPAQSVLMYAGYVVKERLLAVLDHAMKILCRPSAIYRYELLNQA